jgi:hypothetical protein
MAARRGTAEELSFAAEGLVGTAAAAALRRVRSLADQAPSARMFAAISTLIETSQRTADDLAAADRAKDSAASLHLASAIGNMSKLAAAGLGQEDLSMPDFLRRAR